MLTSATTVPYQSQSDVSICPCQSQSNATMCIARGERGGPTNLGFALKSFVNIPLAILDSFKLLSTLSDIKNF